MFGFAALVLIATPLVLQVAHGTSLCKEQEWFNQLTDQCQQCRVCPEKSWLMAPCVEFADAMCVDLVEIARSIKPKNSGVAGWKRWHEMEGEAEDVFTQKEKIHQTNKAKLDDADGMWSQVILVVLCLSFISVAVFAILMAMKCSGRISARENSKNVARARLFSRDRLNTTEYMNNLATLDRRLAIDEILEKRKRAIFEPQLLSENIYTDEVFVDISGLPRDLRRSHDYEELDHRKCLLQMHEQQ